jgi:hypothetical protein
MVERAIGVHQDLRAVAADVFKLQHKPLEIAGGQREQQPIAGPIRCSVHTLQPRTVRIGVTV